MKRTGSPIRPGQRSAEKGRQGESDGRPHRLAEQVGLGWQPEIERPVKRRPGFGGHCRRRGKPLLHLCPESFMVQRCVEVARWDERSLCEGDPAGVEKWLFATN